MGGCATKPAVSADDTEAPQRAEDLAAVIADPGEGKEKEEINKGDGEVVEGRKSLCNLFQEPEKNTPEAGEEKPEKEEGVIPGIKLTAPESRSLF
ncbi:hypothetical protein KSP40_PGU006503 [Platanthera guangdongensis]|uniref:Uncharacterized protein n=1 Tax=Platanthera guangdongensis TaxID=2320717 RepID=A0ABR2LRJ0_9ASPA